MNNLSSSTAVANDGQQVVTKTIQGRSISISKVLFNTIESHFLFASTSTKWGMDFILSTMIEMFDKFHFQNTKLLSFRNKLQSQIDQYYKTSSRAAATTAVDEAFLRRIGYIVDPPSSTRPSDASSSPRMDREIVDIASPQLVVPIDNMKFIVNAMNSRWGSLLQAIRNSDIITNPKQQQQNDNLYWDYIIDKCLDKYIPLSNNQTWKNFDFSHLLFDPSLLSKPEQFIGTSTVIPVTTTIAPSAATTNKKLHEMQQGLYFIHNGLHICIVIDTTVTGVMMMDVLLESCCTVIYDLEDAVAVVDAQDKSNCYQNLSKLFMNTTVSFSPNKPLNPVQIPIQGRTHTTSLSGRPLTLVRNVGIHIKTDMVKVSDSQFYYEHLLDALFTVLAAAAVAANKGGAPIYIVKPKLHGPEEVEFICEVFSFLENKFNLQRNLIKIGIMDEERRTSVNLQLCLEIAKHRVFFINTGFLDRCGDEIRTSTYLGPMFPKEEIKNKSIWLKAYEQLNVINGLNSQIKMQIGKGMWSKPDNMREMLNEKINHCKSGASTAWVPSPLCGTLHALHYHEINYKTQQVQTQTHRLTYPIID